MSIAMLTPEGFDSLKEMVEDNASNIGQNSDAITGNLDKIDQNSTIIGVNTMGIV